MPRCDEATLVRLGMRVPSRGPPEDRPEEGDGQEPRHQPQPAPAREPCAKSQVPPERSAPASAACAARRSARVPHAALRVKRALEISMYGHGQFTRQLLTSEALARRSMSCTAGPRRNNLTARALHGGKEPQPQERARVLPPRPVLHAALG